MRKTLLYLLLLAVLAACVWYILSRNKDQFLNIPDADFSIRDTSAIGSIFLVHARGQSVLLERTPDGWRANREYRVLQSPLNFLLKTLNRQVADAPVPDAQHNGVVKSLATNGIKVEIYDRKGKKMRVFYVGDEAFNLTGTFMLLEGARRPYIVNIPAFAGVLRSRYSPEIRDWRDRTVFNIPPEDIEEISVQYVDEPLNSFIIRREKDSLSVVLEQGMGAPGVLNKERVKGYLGFFTNINCEGFTNGEPFMDSMIAAIPRRCVIDIKGKNGYVQHLTVYWRPLNERSKNLNTPLPGHPDEYDADRYFAVLNNERDTAVIQQFVFDKIFRRGYEFYQDTQPQADTMHVHQHTH